MLYIATIFIKQNRLANITKRLFPIYIYTEKRYQGSCPRILVQH